MIFVTGTGMISAIGLNVEESLASMEQMKTGVGKITLLETIHSDNIPAGEIKLTNNQLLTMAGLEGKSGYSRTALLGIIAAGEALQCAGITDMKGFRTGIISGTSVGGMDKTEKFYPEFFHDNTKGKISDATSHDCGESTERIADRYGIHDYVTTISTACSSAANAIMLGARLIKSGRIDRVLVGGTDALARFTLNGFNSLMILDKQNCRPFDQERTGLNLGEGAGYLVLESEEAVKQSGKKPICILSGYGNSCDAHHQTATSPEGEGPFLSMQAALKISGLNPCDIDYINAHGTGTDNNDLTEGIAMKRLFGDDLPKFSSTKGFTGHTLGAAGGIEAVFSVQAIKRNIMLPNLNFKNITPDLGIAPLTEFLKNVEVRNVLSNSFGFGGNDSSLIFSRI